MKRKLVALVLASCVMSGIFTGCGGSDKIGVEVDASKNTDLSASVTETNTVENSEEAYIEFLDAQTKMEESDSATINTEMIIGITYDGQTEESSQKFDIMRSKIDDKMVVDFVMQTAITSDGPDGAGTQNTENSSNYESELSGYFIDDYLYFEQPADETSEEATCLKEAMTYEDLMSIIGSSYILNDIAPDYISTAAKNEVSTGTEYVFVLDDTKMSEYMINNLAANGLVMSEEEGVTINYANVSANVDAEGVLTAYTFSIDAVIKDAEGETPFKYNIASAFSDVNATNVKVRTEDELGNYMDVVEYAQQLEEEQAAEATTEPTGTPLSEEEMLEMGIDPEKYDVEIITEAKE